MAATAAAREAKTPISTAREAEASSVPTGGLTLSMSIEHPGEGVTLVSSSECMLYFTCFWSLVASRVGAVTGLPHLLAKYRVMALWGQVQVDSDLEAWASVD